MVLTLMDLEKLCQEEYSKNWHSDVCD